MEKAQVGMPCEIRNTYFTATPIPRPKATHINMVIDR